MGGTEETRGWMGRGACFWMVVVAMWGCGTYGCVSYDWPRVVLPPPPAPLALYLIDLGLCFPFPTSPRVMLVWHRVVLPPSLPPP